MSESTDQKIRNAKSALGVASRRQDSTAATEARRELAAAKIEQYIERVVAAAPPLTNDQRSRLTSLLSGGGA